MTADRPEPEAGQADRAPDPPDLAPDAEGPADLGLALWSANVAWPLVDLPDWLRLVDARMAEAAGAGLDLLMLPEYACSAWLAFAPESVGPREELAWLADRAEEALPRLAEMARRRGLAILAGTMPARAAGGIRNRAHLLTPEGGQHRHDKLCLMPDERQPEDWWLEPGASVRLFEWRGWRVAILVCLDSELPALAARLQGLDLDLLLVPSATAGMGGFHRVLHCCQARAVELFAVVANVGTVGTRQRAGRVERNTGGAAVCLPCEAALGGDGRLAGLPPLSEEDGPGRLLLIPGLPLGQVRALRRGGRAEAWPGSWSAAHLRIEMDG